MSIHLLTMPVVAAEMRTLLAKRGGNGGPMCERGDDVYGKR